MDKWKAMNRAEYDVGDAQSKLKVAQDEYKNELVDECAKNIFKILSEERTLTERDLKIFIQDTADKIKNIYQ